MNIINRDINLSQNVIPATPVTLFNFTVPCKAMLKLTHFSNYTDTIAAWSSLMWSIKRNGIGIYPYHALLDQIGLSSDPRMIEPLLIYGGDVITIIALNSYIQTVGMGIALRYEIMGD